MQRTARLATAAIRTGLRAANRTRSSPHIGLVAALGSKRWTSGPGSTSASSEYQSLPPLVRLQQVQLSALATPPGSEPVSLDWTVNDRASDECWAIIGPASEQGGAVRRQLVDILLGRQRPKRCSTTHKYEPVHPFLQPQTQSEGDASTPRSPARSIKHVSFATKMGAGASSGSTGDFTNYSARYGAIREEDRVTLYERLMELLDCPVGLVAKLRFVPDPLASIQNAKDDTQSVGRFKYASEQQRQDAVKKAREADKVIRQMAPLLLIDDQLLHRPLIALSNGQTRRARILSSLISGAEMVVLEEPFSGIDPTTRDKLNRLFAQLHADRKPRLLLVLREQDPIPDLVTHTLCIDDQGCITHIGPRTDATEPNQSQTPAATSASALQPSAAESRTAVGGHHVILRNAAEQASRRGDAASSSSRREPIISIKGVSIVYGDKTVLDRIEMDIHPGDRWILAGDNGSGKTTLLALILGDHPKSFSFPSESLSLFGHARDHPSNARTLINRRIGHLSPELFNAFPRRRAELGGLTVGETIASGFENVFARRAYSQSQKERVWSLLALFADLIKSPQGHAFSSASASGSGIDSDSNRNRNRNSGSGSGSGTGDVDIQALSGRAFAELSHGSQAVVLFLRAVVGNPSLLVLDEPFQGMDARQVQRTRDYLDHPDAWLVGSSDHQRHLDRAARQNMAVVTVSHYESEWPVSFHQLLRLRDGVVVERV
ncbi:P-loop containing nucleoside triphosphate hydrolase protein [Testicularia cyperi]|uniref:P-loop containing nucleoside triphosphate hydrolase protein n=1 Tax=Testicularia cyperi TaxID=1882483 RepID=A0A317XFZ5_9BASI|nr:P-loop containing nucleoside triphosphate hydrolase protein [Testicularia cyperi]PWY97295.1 P-loop containing nucleoside triphosphate hydrolase protein [Testicularia cyperi]